MTAAGAGARDFRQDINGLRAWAVVAVVLYHFSVPGVTGGYAGVDVFFVISGYLMFGIISSGLERGNFSLGRFYLARARRIFPALIVLCIVSLLFGWFFLMPEEFRQLGRHVRESLTFTSNLRYLSESGYFDVASQEKWLLHTWSLSVEWQFYLLLPLLMLLVSWFFPGRTTVMKAVISGLFFISLIFCMWVSSYAPSEAFYTLQTRAWEMLAGALVFMLGQPRLSAYQKRVLELAGLLMIVAAYLLFHTSTQWPGWRALLPVVGTMLVLLAARQGSVFTATSVAQWIGTRSYSIYLWHWPLVVALAYAGLLADPVWVGGAIIFSFLLGHLSYTLIEVRARNGLTKISSGKAAVVLLFTLILVAVFAQQVRLKGFPQRLPSEVALVEAERKNQNRRLEECLDPAAKCIYGSEPLRAVVIGDSHADAVVTAVQTALPDAQGGVLFRGGSGCMVVFGMSSVNKTAHCDALSGEVEQELAEFPKGIPAIMVGRTSKYINAGSIDTDDVPDFHFGKPVSQFTRQLLDDFSVSYVDTLCKIAENRPLYVLRPIPEMPVDVPTVVGRGLLFGEMRRPKVSLQEYSRRHSFIVNLQDQAASRCGVKILDPKDWLCDESYCYGGDDDRPWYRDQDHLSEYGNRRLIPMFETVFQTE